MSAASTELFTRRTPQLMSNPIAPGLMTRCAAARPGHARHGDDDAEHARELRHAVGAEPEAVEPERLDREATDRVEADVAEEERARAAGESRAEPGGEEPEHHEVPDRLVE